MVVESDGAHAASSRGRALLGDEAFSERCQTLALSP